MSKMYSIEILLEIEPTKNNITKIVENALKLNYIFSYKENEPSLLAELVVDKLISDLANANPYNINYDTGIVCTYKSSVFMLHIYNEENYMLLSFLALAYYDYFFFENEEYFDFGRYVKLFINFCGDFPIKKIETSIN